MDTNPMQTCLICWIFYAVEVENFNPWHQIEIDASQSESVRKRKKMIRLRWKSLFLRISFSIQNHNLLSQSNNFPSWWNRIRPKWRQYSSKKPVRMMNFNYHHSSHRLIACLAAKTIFLYLFQLSQNDKWSLPLKQWHRWAAHTSEMMRSNQFKTILS